MPHARRDDLVLALAALIPLALFAVRERVVAGAVGFPLDDSWIHLQFARNLAEGAGFSYNPGRAVAGSTAPLWTLLVAVGVVVGGAPLVVAKVLGIAGTVAAGLATRRAALAWGAAPVPALVAGIGLVWTGALAWGALSGMEVPLAALLVALAARLHAARRLVATAACVGLAALARPEVVVLAPLLVLADRPTWRRAALFAGVTALVLAPAVAFSYATVGAPIPATAAAKIEGGLIGWLSGVRESAAQTFAVRPAAFAWAWIRWLASTHPLLPLALVAIPVAWGRAGRRLGLVALALVVHPLAMALLAPYRDPSFQEGRYSIQLLPLAFVVLAVAASAGGARLVRAAGLVWLALALAVLPRAADRYARAVENINGMQVHLGRWIDEHLPRTARLAVNDIGAIAYVSRREVIDLMGLVTPEIIPYRRRGEAGVIDYVRETCPDYVVVFPAWFPGLTGRTDLLEPVYRVRLDRNLVSGADEMVVYRLRRCAV